MAKVSVIIPVFNGAATLRDAIDSVLAQRFKDSELIVVDDGSTDNTQSIIAEYGNHIRALRQKNSGPAAARNAGVRVGQGEYLAFLDADDKWLPAMLEKTVSALESDSACVLAYGNLAMVDSNGRDLGVRLIRDDFDHAPSMEEILARMWPIMPSATLMRRTAFEACGGFCEEFKNAAYEDAFLWLRMREQGHFRFISDTLAAWRFSSFPKPIKVRPLGVDRATFARLVNERYGIDPSLLAGARLRATRSILGYMGLMALRRGEGTVARQAFIAALRIDPLRLRNHLRLLRTFLPLSFARSLSGRTGKGPAIGAEK